MKIVSDHIIFIFISISYQEKILEYIVLFFVAAEKAKEKLDGRWFGGRRINASLFDLKKFQTGDYSN